MFGTNSTRSVVLIWCYDPLTHLPSCTKEIPFSIHNFLSTAVLFAPPFVNKSAAAWPWSDWMPRSKERCDQLILHSSTMYAWCTEHTAHISVRLSSVSSNGSSSVFLFFAGGRMPQLSRYTHSFVLMTWWLVAQKCSQDTSDITHPWLWACMRTCIPVMCTPVY